MSARFIWSTDKLKKVKLREVREFKITQKGSGTGVVEVYGFFGGAVEVFKGSLDECREFIDTHTEGKRVKETE